MTLFLFKRLPYFLGCLALIIVLAVVVSQHKINHVASQNIESSLSDTNAVSADIAVFVSINQATNFNHVKQRSVDFVFVVLIALLLVAALNYLSFTLPVLPPPWYITLRYKSRLYLSCFKISNLQYKNRLSRQH